MPRDHDTCDALTTDSAESHLRFLRNHWFIQPMVRSRATVNFFCFRTGAFPMGLRLTVTVVESGRAHTHTHTRLLPARHSLFSTSADSAILHACQLPHPQVRPRPRRVRVCACTHARIRLSCARTGGRGWSWLVAVVEHLPQGRKEGIKRRLKCLILLRICWEQNFYV